MNWFRDGNYIRLDSTLTLSSWAIVEVVGTETYSFEPEWAINPYFKAKILVNKGFFIENDIADDRLAFLSFDNLSNHSEIDVLSKDKRDWTKLLYD